MKSNYLSRNHHNFGNCPGANHKKVMSRGINEHYSHLLGVYSVDY